MAFSMMQRCLERSESLGLPLLQCFCCMAIARTLTLQPERKLALSNSFGEAAERTGALGSVPSFGLSRNGNGNRQSFGLLAALSHPKGSPGRDAFAHGTMASLLSTSAAGALRETRPKVLLCNAGISEVFGLHGPKKFATKLLLELYKDHLTPEELSLALCQGLSQGLCQGDKSLHELPHAAVWMMPKLCSDLLKRNSSAVELGAVVVPTAGALRAVPQSLAADAAVRWRIVANEARLHQGQLLAAMKSLGEGTSSSSSSSSSGSSGSAEVARNLLSSAEIHLKSENPTGAMAPCMRCISVAENAKLLDVKAEAQLMLAKLKLEMRDFLGALQLAEEIPVTSAKLRAELCLMQAETLLDMLARKEAATDLLEAIVERLQMAVSNFQAAKVSDSNVGHCHYLLARCYHQMGNVSQRDHHAREFRLSRAPVRRVSSTGHPM